MALQLHPDPAGGARDPFWPLGTRKLLTFVITALCVLREANLRPIRALKVGYHEVRPWRDQVAPNPLHGGERFMGKLKMVVRDGRARATRAGRKITKPPRRPFWRPLLGALRPLAPGLPVMVLGAGALIVLQFGWPHLLFEYTRSHSWCRYIGPPVVSEGFEIGGADRCPLIVWRK